MNTLGNFNGSIRLILGQDKQTTDSRFLLYGTYQQQGDTKDALKVAATLDHMHELSADNATSIGDLAKLAHDNKLALHYYEEAKTIMQQQKYPPVRTADVDALNQKIKEVQ